MHRSRTAVVEHAPTRMKGRAATLHRRGVQYTYRLHDRYLSNRRSRALYEANRPSLDGTQVRIVRELDEQGYSVAAVQELLTSEEWDAVQGEAHAFVDETERGLAGEGDNLRRREGKEFLVRKYDRGGKVGLDNPWLSACLSRRMVDIASVYLQLWSKLEYLDLWYSLPVGEGGERRASQIWHRDFDDRHLLKAFLYLSDVDASCGPFEYVPGSQPGGPYSEFHPWEPMAIGRVADAELAKAVPAEAVKTFTAPRGTMIFCNTSGLHRGGFVESRPRILATVTYCSPASLHSLTERNYALPPGTDTSALDPVVRYALS
jgi:hypothetical protein